jgi:hypothetical protein
MEFEVILSDSLPNTMKPLHTYETRYVYTGFGRYDIEANLFSRIEMRGDKMFYSESKTTNECFPKGYNVECVRVTVYSKAPRMWSEEISPHEIYFFREKQGQQED